jgi:hypothetical protein
MRRLDRTVRAANLVPFGNNSQLFCWQPGVPGCHALPIAFTVAKPLRIGSGTGHLPPIFRAGW